ncbi:MAG: hypothetical protein JXA10_14105 [Anaerolineae bacterium]|nr:hypothetical protein [Anaerolineae bacterium]
MHTEPKLCEKCHSHEGKPVQLFYQESHRYGDVWIGAEIHNDYRTYGEVKSTTIYICDECVAKNKHFAINNRNISELLPLSYWTDMLSIVFLLSGVIVLLASTLFFWGAGFIILGVVVLYLSRKFVKRPDKSRFELRFDEQYEVRKILAQQVKNGELDPKGNKGYRFYDKKPE